MLIFLVFVGRRWRYSECFAKDDALEARVLSFGGAESILSVISDECSQSSIALLVGEEVLPCCSIAFANCTHSYRVV